MAGKSGTPRKRVKKTSPKKKNDIIVLDLDDDEEEKEEEMSSSKPETNPEKKRGNIDKRVKKTWPKKNNDTIVLDLDDDEEEKEKEMSSSKPETNPEKKRGNDDTSKKSGDEPTDSFDIIIPSSLLSTTNNSECTLLVQIDPDDSTKGLEFEGASGAIGRFEADDEGVKLDLMGYKYHGTIHPGPTAMVLALGKGGNLKVDGMTNEFVTLSKMQDTMANLDAKIKGEMDASYRYEETNVNRRAPKEYEKKKQEESSAKKTSGTKRKGSSKEKSSSKKQSVKIFN